MHTQQTEYKLMDEVLGHFTFIYYADHVQCLQNKVVGIGEYFIMIAFCFPKERLN